MRQRLISLVADFVDLYVEQVTWVLEAEGVAVSPVMIFTGANGCRSTCSSPRVVANVSGTSPTVRVMRSACSTSGIARRCAQQRAPCSFSRPIIVFTAAYASVMS